MNDTAGRQQQEDQAPEMPHFMPSSLVAIATVFPVLLTLILVFLCLFLNPRCLKNQKKKNHKNEEKEMPAEEMLREDSVVIHDVGFPDEAYHPVRGNHQAKPEPSPSIFHDDVFLQEVLTVADVYSPTRSILNRKYDSERKMTGGADLSKLEAYPCVNKILEEIIDGLIEKEVKIYVNVKRNSSFREAIRRGLDFHDFNVLGEDSILTSSLKSIDLNSKESLQDFAQSMKENSLDDTHALLDSSIKMCEDQIKDDISVADLGISSSSKWRSTPILDLDINTRSSGFDRDIDDDSGSKGVSNRGSESRNYSPVYKMGHHGSFDTSLFSRSKYSSASKKSQE